MSDVLARLATALADRYTVLEELGAGGMATVFLAEDVKHRRKVAVKMLRPELAASLGHERFLLEIATTANLRHPHILPLYDSGEASGYLYYVMPFAEGETLRDRISREKQLPIDEALRIAREVADALSYAHNRGVIHRDIKPENILLESGHAVVADFGIARAVDAAGGARLTETGLAVGTPTYMSPEQAAGQGELDGRSDLYALGCVLYEMLAGQAPFTGPTVESVVHQHLTVDPPPITNLRPAVPLEIVGVLQRALAKNPADRFNPVAQFAEALGPAPTATVTGSPARTLPRKGNRRGVLAALAAAVVFAVLGGLAIWSRGVGGPAAPEVSVAVLPFVDLTPDESDAYLGDGIAETLINALANAPGIEVVARTSAFSFRGREEDVRQIGRQLGVANVLEGSVQRSGERLRVTAQLVKTSDGLHLWSQNFDRDAGDIFAVQDEVAAAVVTALQGELLGAQVGPSTGTRDPAAYDAYLQGRFYWAKRSVPDLRQAIVLFEEAIARDSAYAEAWAGLADAYMTMPFYSPVASADFIPRAKAAAEHALTLSPDLAEAHTTLAYALTVYEWNWTAAEQEFRRAIELKPGYATAHKWYTDLLLILGRHEEALASARRAAELDPRSPNVLTIVALALWAQGRDDEALQEFDRALELDPMFPLTLIHASSFHWARGDTARFFALRERLDALAGLGEVSVAALRAAHAAGGSDSVARLQVAAAGPQQNLVERARWQVVLGDLDAAYRDLQRAADQRVVWLPYITVLPYLTPLRADRRYQALLQRLGLPTHR